MLRYDIHEYDYDVEEDTENEIEVKDEVKPYYTAPSPSSTTVLTPTSFTFSKSIFSSSSSLAANVRATPDVNTVDPSLFRNVVTASLDSGTGTLDLSVDPEGSDCETEGASDDSTLKRAANRDLSTTHYRSVSPHTTRGDITPPLSPLSAIEVKPIGIISVPTPAKLPGRRTKAAPPSSSRQTDTDTDREEGAPVATASPAATPSPCGPSDDDCDSDGGSTYTPLPKRTATEKSFAPRQKKSKLSTTSSSGRGNRRSLQNKVAQKKYRDKRREVANFNQQSLISLFSMNTSRFPSMSKANIVKAIRQANQDWRDGMYRIDPKVAEEIELDVGEA